MMNYRIVTKTLLAVSLLAGTTVSAGLSHVTMAAPFIDEDENKLSVADLDPALIEQAKEALKRLIKDKEVELTDVREDKLNKKLFLRTAEEKTKLSADGRYNDEAVVTFDLDTKKVVAVCAAAKLASVHAGFKQKAEAFLKDVNKNAGKYAYRDIIQVGLDMQTKNWEFTADKFWLRLNEDGSIVRGTFDDYPLEQAGQALKNGQQALKDASIPNVKLTRANRAINVTPAGSIKKSDMLMLQDSMMANYMVSVGAMTGNVYGLTLGNDMASGTKQDIEEKFKKPYYTTEQAIDRAQPTVKKLFGIELKGSQVDIKANAYTFTKKNQSTVKIQINEKGKIFAYEQFPVNGTME